eukprot:20349_4
MRPAKAYDENRTLFSIIDPRRGDGRPRREKKAVFDVFCQHLKRAQPWPSTGLCLHLDFNSIEGVFDELADEPGYHSRNHLISCS